MRERQQEWSRPGTSPTRMEHPVRLQALDAVMQRISNSCNTVIHPPPASIPSVSNCRVSLPNLIGTIGGQS